MTLPAAGLRRFRALMRSFKERPTQRLARLVEMEQRRLSDADGDKPLNRATSDKLARLRKKKRRIERETRRRNRK